MVKLVEMMLYLLTLAKCFQPQCMQIFWAMLNNVWLKCFKIMVILSTGSIEVHLASITHVKMIENVYWVQ